MQENDMEKVDIEKICEWIDVHVQSASYKESKHSPSTKFVTSAELIELIKESFLKL